MKPLKNQPSSRLSLSTAFNISRHSEWKPLLEEMLSMGYSSIELNVEIPEKWISEIEKSVNSGEVRISSLHNFCPRVDPLPAGRSYFSAYQPTADDEEERKQFVNHIKRTISCAAGLGAGAVVMHAGEIKTEIEGRSVYAHIVKHGMENGYFRRLRDNCLADRKKNSVRYFDFLKQTLNSFLKFAEENKVVVALENRFHVNEIPDIEEIGIILKEFRGAPIGFWYDAGHAEIMKRMGIVKNSLDYLEHYRENLTGMHLHDFRGVEDHFAPGTGEIDFSFFLPYIKETTQLVVEAHPKATVKEVSAAAPFLAEKLSL